MNNGRVWPQEGRGIRSTKVVVSTKFSLIEAKCRGRALITRKSDESSRSRRFYLVYFRPTGGSGLQEARHRRPCYCRWRAAGHPAPSKPRFAPLLSPASRYFCAAAMRSFRPLNSSHTSCGTFGPRNFSHSSLSARSRSHSAGSTFSASRISSSVSFRPSV